jgi:hypothetical protein
VSQDEARQHKLSHFWLGFDAKKTYLPQPLIGHTEPAGNNTRRLFRTVPRPPVIGRRPPIGRLKICVRRQSRAKSNPRRPNEGPPKRGRHGYALAGQYQWRGGKGLRAAEPAAALYRFHSLINYIHSLTHHGRD